MKKDLLLDIQATSQDGIREQVRDFVAAALGKGASPQTVSEELVYIAAEMSLHIAENKLCVIPILLESLTQAAHDFVTHMKTEKKESDEFDFAEVDCELIH